MNRHREIAKFACGAEAFHALVHAYFWSSGKTLRAFGVKESPQWHLAAAVGNGLASLALGLYAWGASQDDGTRDSGDRDEESSHANSQMGTVRPVARPGAGDQ